MNIIATKRIPIFLLALLIFSVSPPGVAVEAAELGGPAFSDPDHVAPMPESWGDTPIRYQDWAANAALAVTLDQHLYPALLPFVQRFARERNVDVAVREGTCGISQGLLATRHVDMAGFCCPPGEVDRLPGLRFHTLGIASVAVLTHPDNPVENLTSDQVRAIFRGDIPRWSDPGLMAPAGFGLPIQPIARLHCKTRPGHWRLILDNEDLFGPLTGQVGTIPEMIGSVAGFAGAIGFEVVWNQSRHREHGQVRTVRIDGIDPTDHEALAAGRYPFYRVYNITTWESAGSSNPLSMELAGFLMESLERVKREHHLVPSRRLRASGWRFRDDELIGEPGR